MWQDDLGMGVHGCGSQRIQELNPLTPFCLFPQAMSLNLGFNGAWLTEGQASVKLFGDQ